MKDRKYDNETIHAIIACIFNHQNQVLMFLKEGETWEQGWEPIKGKIRPDETEDDAVKREIKEEAGLDEKLRQVEIIRRLPGYCNATQPYHGGRTVNVRAAVFPCRYIKGTVRIGEKEHKEFNWMDIRSAIDKNYLQKYGPEMIGPAHSFFLEHI